MQPVIDPNLISYYLDLIGFILAIIGLISPIWLISRIRNWVGRGLVRFWFWSTNKDVPLKILLIAHGNDLPDLTDFSDEFVLQFANKFHRVTPVSSKTMNLQLSEFSGTWKLSLYDQVAETIEDLQLDTDSKFRLHAITSGLNVGYRNLKKQVNSIFTELTNIEEKVRQLLNLSQLDRRYIVAAEWDFSKIFVPSGKMSNIKFDVAFADESGVRVLVRITPGKILMESESPLPLAEKLSEYLQYQPH